VVRTLDQLPADIPFDHRQILEDFKARRYPGGFEAAPAKTNPK